MIASSFSVSFSKDWVDRLRGSSLLDVRPGYREFGVGVREKGDKSGVESYVVFR